MKKTITLCILALCVSLNVMAQTINGTFAIQNVRTGKNLRPFEAGSQDGNKIVLYNHIEWKCMTWDFINIKDNTYQLKNLFTSKTFQPEGNAIAGCALNQQKLIAGSPAQQWEFVPAGDNNYYIRLKGTELYITLSDASGKTNSAIVLQPKQNSDLQLWRLVRQNPTS
jgi:hypothetical protein